MASRADSFGEKIKLLGEAVAKLLAESSKMKQKLYELEIDIEGRMDWKSGKEEMQKKQEKVEDHVAKKVGGIELGLESHKRELSERIAKIDWKVSDLKKNTLREFEEYRASDARINSQFAEEVSKRVEEKILREIIQKNKMSQDIKKEVIQHFNIENQVNNHNIQRRLNTLEEEYQYLLNLISAKIDRKEVQEIRLSVERIHDNKETALRSEVSVPQSEQVTPHKSEGLMQEKKSEERNKESEEGRIGGSRELAIRNELSLIRERLKDIEVREVELTQRLLDQSNQVQLHLISKKESNSEDRISKLQLKLNQKMHKLKDLLETKIREVQVRMKPEEKLEPIAVEGDGLTRLLQLLNLKAGADDMREFVLSSEFKFQKLNDRLRQLGFQVQKNTKVIQNIVGLIKGVGGGGEFNNILLSTKGLQCLSCGRNEYGKVILNNPPQGYTHSSPYRSANRDYSPAKGIEISPHVPRGHNHVSEGSANARSPDFLNRSNKLLVGSAKLSLEEYMSKNADILSRREHNSSQAFGGGGSVRSSFDTPLGKEMRVQTQRSHLNERVRSKSPFAEQGNRYYFYQSPPRSSTPS